MFSKCEKIVIGMIVRTKHFKLEYSGLGKVLTIIFSKLNWDTLLFYIQRNYLITLAC
jgi:hypothetical protein